MKLTIIETFCSVLIIYKRISFYIISALFKFDYFVSRAFDKSVEYLSIPLVRPEWYSLAKSNTKALLFKGCSGHAHTEILKFYITTAAF